MTNTSKPFKLDEAFIAQFEGRQPEWGPLGYITYKRTYARAKEDGTTEEFYETMRRVVEGVYEIQRKHCKHLGLPWSATKAQRSAQEMFIRGWEFKWLPPGRGMWAMGTSIIDKVGAAALMNCAFVSTKDLKVDFASPFTFLMDMLMLGVGVGFDTLGVGTVTIKTPVTDRESHVVEDDREGWVDLVGRILNAFAGNGTMPLHIDYSLIREAGAPLKTFGGVASGSGPLENLMDDLVLILVPLIGQKITEAAIVDIGNVIGKCVVAGNVRRSAELVIGAADSEEFISLKDKDLYATELFDHRWASNNSVAARRGMDYHKLAARTASNGEPGYIWLDNARQFGRLKDGDRYPDLDVMGFNPCFHPDTVVETVDGPVAIKDITEPTLVYTMDKDRKLAIRQATASFITKRDAKTLSLRLSNGRTLTVTPDHKIMTLAGWVEAQNLKVYDEVVGLCRTRRGAQYAGVRLSTQPLSESVMEHRFVYEGVHGSLPSEMDVHHVHGNTYDNAIDNLRALPHNEHALLTATTQPNDHQVWGEDGKFTTHKESKHGAKRIIPVPSHLRTRWPNQPRVVGIEAGPVVDVYDITVEDTHCLIADSVVAHNCVEQPLEDRELCCLVETFPSRHESMEDYRRTLKFAYLYGKTVTLIPTHDERSNAVILRNRRIGTSQSGITQAMTKFGRRRFLEMCDEGYAYLRNMDRIYSRWLCVPTSIKITTVKPSGTVSLLPGVTPGIHYPHSEFYFRTIRFQMDSPLVEQLAEAGYHIEIDAYSPATAVAYFPIHEPYFDRSKTDVTMWEQLENAAAMQYYWSDNGVSATITFNADEAKDIPKALELYESRLKAISFLPLEDHGYVQAPYQEITRDEYEAAAAKIRPMAHEIAKDLTDAYCDADSCLIPVKIAVA